MAATAATMLPRIITRYVKEVDRTRTPREMLKATGRRQCVDPDVVDVMPRGEGEEGGVFFLSPPCYLDSGGLDREYEQWGRKPADPYTLAQINIDDHAFADNYPNSTRWKDANGDWCFMAFSCGRGVRRVDVFRYNRVYYARWWFASVPK